ncbi:inositol polyphosphate 1-phosphatase [Cydia splendana]|uniref:inositol polyphosphate 1-phosphatase n=1 Tax=Cydia splendana TaxID=1100963 RepID=UPI002142FB7A
MANVLEALIYASERAACIARYCAASLSDENLVVTEKSGDEANSRFEHDFKTIADVLAQEAAKVEIGHHCQNLASSVWGEECGEINGHPIKLGDNIDKTALLLSQIVPKEQALKLAEGCHCELNPKLFGELPYDLPAIDDATLGVWIDPIDATAEFIAGVKNKHTADSESGLSCVTVLIGAFVKSTGEPVMGVVNQPFYDNGNGRILWGASYSDYGRMGGCETPSSHNDNTVLVSSAESPELVERFRSSGWEVKPAKGCGHKLLKVALGEAAAYFVTKGTTFYWDTCAPHAVIKASGGDILSCATLTPVTYMTNTENEKAHCNSDGIIAYSQQKVLYGIKLVFNKT